MLEAARLCTSAGPGTALARGTGRVAGYLAGAAVITIGARMLLAGDKDDEERAARIITSRGLALIARGLSISLDELAIGFTIGLAHLPVTTVIAGITLQAFIAAQLGPGVGAKIGEHWRERVEQVAGIALVLLRAYLIGEQLAPVSAACQDHCASEPAADSNRPADRSPGI